MGEIKVSVVIPIYNAEKYLERSIRSILDQSLKELELILINDGSRDGSGEICDKFSKEDNRITVIHKENGGLSSSRNTGIKKARGSYIQFVDADDYVEEKMLEEQHNLAVDTGAQITMCGMKYDIYLKGGGVIADESSYRDMIISNHIFFYYSLYKGQHIGTGTLYSSQTFTYKQSSIFLNYIKKHIW